MAAAVDPLNAQPAEDELSHDGRVVEGREHDRHHQPRQQGGESTSRWLGEIGVDIRSLATTIRHTASGVATFVHRSALTVAHEIARLEEEEEEEVEEENHDQQKSSPSELQDVSEVASSNKKKQPVSLRLPWELLQPDRRSNNAIGVTASGESCAVGQQQDPPPPAAGFIEDGELKRRILLLSHDETSFLQPHRQVLEEEAALDASRIDLIQRLLRADPFLSIAHKNLQSSISEATFWCNYFEACSAARQKYLQDQLEALDDQNHGGEVSEEEEDEDEDEVGGEEEEEDSSFVCIDASVRSYRSAGMRSVDSLVLVESSRFANSMKV
jgi:hypothetical protein